MARGSPASSTVLSRLSLSLLCVLWALSLGGCGGLAFVIVAPIAQLAVDAALIAEVKSSNEPSPQELAVAGMDGSTIEYPIPDVYRGLLWAADAEGMTIITANEADYFLRVSYPFSLIHNNWGGEITITCVIDGSGTRVLFGDNGRDAAGRVQKLESRLLDQTMKRLRQSSPGH